MGGIGREHGCCNVSDGCPILLLGSRQIINRALVEELEVVREVSVNARDEQPPKHDHQSHYTHHKFLWTVSPNNSGDVPMRIFSQPSTIVSAKVASKQIRHLQRKCRKEERGGMYTREKSVDKRDTPLSSSFCFVAMDGVQVQGAFVKPRNEDADLPAVRMFALERSRPIT